MLPVQMGKHPGWRRRGCQGEAASGDPLRRAVSSHFLIYDLRHPWLTRWAKTMDPFTLMKLAGHSDPRAAMRYVHLNDDDVLAAMEKVGVAKGGHEIRYSAESRTFGSSFRKACTEPFLKPILVT